jgi:hypothetical protein
MRQAGWLACLVTCNILVVEERWVSMQESAPVGLMKLICDCRQTVMAVILFVLKNVVFMFFLCFCRGWGVWVKTEIGYQNA